MSQNGTQCDVTVEQRTPLRTPVQKRRSVPLRQWNLYSPGLGSLEFGEKSPETTEKRASLKALLKPRDENEFFGTNKDETVSALVGKGEEVPEEEGEQEISRFEEESLGFLQGFPHFYRQKQAFDERDKCVDDFDKAVFVCETLNRRDESKATRLFVVMSYFDVWEYYCRHPHAQHVYEIVRENWPCKLYFDLEYQKECNKDVDGVAAVKRLQEIVKERLRYFYNVECAYVIDLESCTDTKFSYHVIFGLKGAMFENNQMCGDFVRCLVAEEERKQDSVFFVKSPSGTRVPMIDIAVYSKNRHFRISNSSKFGKQTKLEATGKSKDGSAGEKELFFKSMICYDETWMEEEKRMLRTSDALHPMEADRDVIHRIYCASRGLTKQPREGPVVMNIPRAGGEHSVIEYAPHRSPFPAIDDYISKMVSRGEVRGYIRCSKYAPDTHTITYFIAGNRYCENIQRQHKSNNVMYVCNLETGTYRQKCLDPDCQRYESIPRNLPIDILPTF